MSEPQKTQENVFGVIWHPTDPNLVLLGLRAELPLWYFPGGKKDNPEETTAKAIQREVAEESGLSVDVQDACIGTMRYTTSRNIRKTVTFVSCRAQSDDPQVMDEEIAWDWFDIENLPDNLYPPFRTVIADAAAGKTHQVYLDTNANSTKFLLSLNADQIAGLDTWLIHPNAEKARQKDIDNNITPFPYQTIQGIDPYIYYALTMKHQDNLHYLTELPKNPLPAPLSCVPKPQ